MKLDSNTVLISGGGTGIGRGLAIAFHQLGNRVLIGGRRAQPLMEVSEAHPGIEALKLDLVRPESIHTAAAWMKLHYPDFNVLINNAGIQRAIDFGNAEHLFAEHVEEEIDINFTGVVQMCRRFIPLLRGKPGATIINVSSGLAFVPLARVPVYCATKAAVHSFTVSLRHQLRDAGIRVIELIPPYVATDLQQGRSGGGAPPMPLDEFIAEAMRLLATDQDELAVGPAQFLRSAEGAARDAVFARMNG
jgi:uncharacterized oxidoreductase